MEHQTIRIGWVETGSFDVSVEQHVWKDSLTGRVETTYEISLRPSELSGALICSVENVPHLLRAIQRALWMASQYAADRVTLDLEQLRQLCDEGIIRSRKLP